MRKRTGELRVEPPISPSNDRGTPEQIQQSCDRDSRADGRPMRPEVNLGVERNRDGRREKDGAHQRIGLFFQEGLPGLNLGAKENKLAGDLCGGF